MYFWKDAEISLKAVACENTYIKFSPLTIRMMR